MGVEVRALEGEPATAVARAIGRGLIAFNEAKAGATGGRPLTLELADSQGRTASGLLGETHWNVMHVELLWIEDAQRGTGYGLRLMQAAEAEARARGIEVIYLNTYSYQAPGFYEKVGCAKIGELKDMPKGESRIFYSKRIDG